MKRGKKFFAAIFFTALVLLCALETDFSFSVLLLRGGRFWDILRDMLPPDFAFWQQAALPLWATVEMSVLGTALGALLGLGAALFSNARLNPCRLLRIFSKGCIHLLRCIPALILALLATFAAGIGTFAGTLALAVSAAAVLARLGCEDMENADTRSFAALQAAGCGRLKAFWRTIFPAVLPGYLTNGLYLWEANVRHAAILGYVGAGGIGLLLNERLAWRQYAQVGMILLLLYFLVLVSEMTGEWLRHLLHREIRAEKWQKRAAFLTVMVLLAASFSSLSLPEKTGSGLSAALAMGRGLLHPDRELLFSAASDGVPALLVQTFCIAFLGTLGGTVLALCFSFASSFRLVPAVPAVFCRLLLLGVRTIPAFVYGLMWIRVTGPGPFAGVLTLMLCSVGLLSKRFLIALDTISPRPVQALRAMGCGRAAALRWGIWPQLRPHIAAAVLYRLDVNLREAAVLGLVGAGGIGTPLILALMHYAWEEAGAFLWGLVVLVSLAEIVSEELRKRKRLF